MITGHYSFKIKPMSAKPDTYEMREYGYDIDASEIEFDEAVSIRDRSLVLNYMAADFTLMFAVTDGAIPPEFYKQHMKELRSNLAMVMDQDVYARHISTRNS